MGLKAVAIGRCGLKGKDRNCEGRGVVVARVNLSGAGRGTAKGRCAICHIRVPRIVRSGQEG